MRFVNLWNIDEATKNKYSAAYDALNELMKMESGTDLVGRCYSDVIYKERENIFMERRGVKKTKGIASAKRIIGKQGNINLLIDKVPGSDHSNLWIKNGKPYSYTFEPYALNKNTLKKLIDYCDQNGLDFNISNYSFHYPAGTFLVEIKKSHSLKIDSEKEELKLIKQNIVTLKETTYQKPTELYSVVKKCVICKGKHTHAAEEGNVVAHCINLDLPTTYDLVIDRNNAENLRLAEKYNIDLGNSLQSEVIANETKFLSN